MLSESFLLTRRWIYYFHAIFVTNQTSDKIETKNNNKRNAVCKTFIGIVVAWNIFNTHATILLIEIDFNRNEKKNADRIRLLLTHHSYATIFINFVEFHCIAVFSEIINHLFQNSIRLVHLNVVPCMEQPFHLVFDHNL